MSEQIHKILIVDDEPDIVELLKYNIKKEGFKVETAYDGKEAVEKAKVFQPNMVLIDIMMPNMDGVEACRQIREITNLKDIFIIFLTARSEEFSEIAAFDAGANDYLVKPIKPRALMSRIHAYFKNQKTEDTDILNVKDLVIDKNSYTVTKRDVQMILPKKEFEILYFLANRPNKVYSREDILSSIWGDDVYVLARTVDVHIRKIREKIGEDYIYTVKGVGYKFVIE